MAETLEDMMEEFISNWVLPYDDEPAKMRKQLRDLCECAVREHEKKVSRLKGVIYIISGLLYLNNLDEIRKVIDEFKAKEEDGNT